MKHFHFLLRNWMLFPAIFLAGLGSSLLEGIGISFIFPILENSQTIPEEVPFPLNRLLEAFAGVSTADRLQTIAVLLVVVICSKNVLLFLSTFLTCKLTILSQKHFQLLCFKQLTKVGMGYFHSKKGGEFQTIRECSVCSQDLDSTHSTC